MDLVKTMINNECRAVGKYMNYLMVRVGVHKTHNKLKFWISYFA